MTSTITRSIAFTAEDITLPVSAAAQSTGCLCAVGTLLGGAHAPFAGTAVGDAFAAAAAFCIGDAECGGCDGEVEDGAGFHGWGQGFRYYFEAVVRRC